LAQDCIITTDISRSDLLLVGVVNVDDVDIANFIRYFDYHPVVVIVVDVTFLFVHDKDAVDTIIVVAIITIHGC
jgi:hypothetical protein